MNSYKNPSPKIPQTNTPLKCSLKSILVTHFSYNAGDGEEREGRGGLSNRQKAERLLKDVQPLDSQLANLLSRRIYGEEGFHKILTLR